MWSIGCNNKESMKELRIVSLGKTGVGKSYSGNTILCNPRAFQAKSSSASVTQKCKSATATVNGRKIKYIDTPGFFDTHVSQEQLRSEIIRSITACAPGPHAFLILLKVETYTDQEVEIVRKITETFGEDALKYAVVLFTHGDNLDEGQTIEEFVRQNSELQKLVNKCGGRCHVIDNKHWNQQRHGYRSNRVQIESLMNTIDEMSVVRNERYYTNEMLQEVQRNIDNEMQVVRAASRGRWSENQIREEAEDRVHTKFIVKLAGVTTGVLLGALLGVKQFMYIVVNKMINEPHFRLAAQLGAAAAVLPGINIAADAVCVGVLTGAAVFGAAKGAQTALDAVEGEQTIRGAIRKAYQACINEEEVDGNLLIIDS